MIEEKIGRYIIKDVLGEGAMGRVYACYDPNLERPVAIKTMRTGNLQHDDLEEFKERFAQESKVSGRLTHPNIVGIYDSGMHGKEPFLVMEYIDGVPLDTFTRKNYKTILEQFVPLIGQTAAGLDFAHEEEVIHRDIKPGNIMITSSRSGKLRSKILDFGLARLQDSKITQTGFFLGTPSYASPEQVITGKVDFRSDIFSFGTVVYELLTGRLPFEAESLHAILYQIANEKPKLMWDDLSSLLDTAALHRVFLKMFAKKPERRYQTATGFVEALKPILGDLPSLAEQICLLREENVVAGIEDSLETALIDSSALDAESLALKQQENETQRLINQARAQFETAFKTGNLSSIRFCLRELTNLGADTTREEQLVRELEEKLRQDEQNRRENERDRLVGEARKAFQLALEAKNPGSCRYCLQELNALGADHQTEKEALATLETDLETAQKLAQKEAATREEFRHHLRSRDIPSCEKLLEKLKDLDVDIQWEKRALMALHKQKQKDEMQRESWIRKVRVQFDTAVQEKHLTRCRQLITELESLLKVDASKEKEVFLALEKALREEQDREQNLQNVENLRHRFAGELAARRVKDCRGIIRELKGLGADVTGERDALKEVKKLIAEEEAKRLADNMIQHTRENFQKALAEQNVDTAHYYLKELKQLTPDVSPERKHLDRLNARLIKESIINKQRLRFRQADEESNLEKARYYLKELELEGVDTTEEKQALEDLVNRTSVKSQHHAQMIERARDEFSKAISRKDVTAGEHCLHVLEGLEVDVIEETRQLAELKIASQKMQYVSDDHRRKLVKRFRRDFQKALEARQVEICRHHIQSLVALDADVSQENQAFHALTSGKHTTIDKA